MNGFSCPFASPAQRINELDQNRSEGLEVGSPGDIGNNMHHREDMLHDNPAFEYDNVNIHSYDLSYRYIISLLIISLQYIVISWFI